MSFVPNCDLKRLNPMSNDYFLIKSLDIIDAINYNFQVCRRSSVVELQPSKLIMRVRFPSSAPYYEDSGLIPKIGFKLFCYLIVMF